MKISQEPTDHILVRANCQSERDNCDFAIITCGESWKELMRKRLEAAVSFFTDYDFNHFSYRDDSAEFYASNDGEIEKLLAETGGKQWAFVTFDDGEEESFRTPESRLECYSLNLYRDGSGLFKACGKHTGDEFYTADLPLTQIAATMMTGSNPIYRRTESRFGVLGFLIHYSVMAFLKQEHDNSAQE